MYAGSAGRGDGRTVAHVHAEELQAGPGDRLELILSPDPAPGNWIRLDPDASTLIVRQTFQDRTREQPARLVLECLDRPGPPPPLTPAKLGRALDRDYLRRRLGIAPGQKILLHSGGITDVYRSLELAESVRRWPPDWTLVIHGFSTIFPIPLGQAASFNPDLVAAAASAAAHEAAEAGIDWTFAPMLDVGRDPRWGRIAETCGEDPFLTARLGAAMVRGFQGEQVADGRHVAA